MELPELGQERIFFIGYGLNLCALPPQFMGWNLKGQGDGVGRWG